MREDRNEELLNKLVYLLNKSDSFFIIILYFVNLQVAPMFCKYIILFYSVIIDDKLMKNSGEKNFVEL